MTKASEENGKKGNEVNAENGSCVEEKAETSVQAMTGAEEQQTEPEGKVSGEEPDAAEAGVLLEERVQQLVQENEELQDKYVRLMADFENFRKRANKEKSDIIQYGNEGLLKDVLPIIDNIERLLTYSYREESWKSFQEGIELLLSEISRTLANYGVEPIEALGKTFDPNLHEAMQRAETEDVEPNTVVEVYQKGYLYRGRMLRPSRVVVAVAPKGAEVAEGQEEARGPDESNRQGDKERDEGKDEPSPIN